MIKRITSLIRQIIKQWFPQLQLTLVLDDRENLVKHLNTNQSGLGYLLNRRNDLFNSWIKEQVTGQHEHIIFGDKQVLSKLGLDNIHLEAQVHTVGKLGKNGADLELVSFLFDELLFKVRITNVVIISADSDFSIVPQRLRTHGITSQLISPTANAKTLKEVFCSEISIEPFIQNLNSLYTDKFIFDEHTKAILKFSIFQYVNKDKKVNLATVGAILIKYFDIKSKGYFGLGALKPLLLVLAEDKGIAIEGDYLVFTQDKLLRLA
ncbi:MULTISPECIES: NYN domain-containing protein [unclassified Pseudoalteromonas]|uniref:NYN domain-containing protein n=1 Tax=unclassified Pseudoalteromonas TaxID=194690 RepID=UPI0005A7F36D|nr:MULTISPECIES: NYN domain-containing protein [unclassified Pseudoalteromonas]